MTVEIQEADSVGTENAPLRELCRIHAVSAFGERCDYLLLLTTTYYNLLLLTTTCYYLLLLTTTYYYLLLLTVQHELPQRQQRAVAVGHE